MNWNLVENIYGMSCIKIDQARWAKNEKNEWRIPGIFSWKFLLIHLKIIPISVLLYTLKSWTYNIKCFTSKWHDQDRSFCPDPLRNMAATGYSCFWLANFKKSSPLQPLAQMNRNLVGSIYGRSSILIDHFVLIH
jgi:hypothetical protein